MAAPRLAIEGVQLRGPPRRRRRAGEAQARAPIAVRHLHVLPVAGDPALKGLDDPADSRRPEFRRQHDGAQPMKRSRRRVLTGKRIDRERVRAADDSSDRKRRRKCRKKGAT